MSTQATGLPARINAAIWAWYGFVAVYALFSAPFSALRLVLEGRWYGPTLFFSALVAAVAAAVAWRFRTNFARLAQDVGERMAAVPARHWLFYVVSGGIVLRVVYVAIFPTFLVSDFATYAQLAERLYRGQSYYTAGTYANWPPGLPFFLALHYLIFGVKPWVIPLSNLLLYAVSILVIHRLGREVASEATARIATLLIAIWPNHVMCSGLADKELLVIPIISGALLAYVLAAKSRAHKTGLRWAALCGVLLAAFSLTQPSLMLFPGMLVVYELARGDEAQRAIFRLAVAAIAMVLTIAPWTIRNYMVLGAFVPISTAGGKTFYGANNPLATGGNIPKNEKSLDEFDELTGNRLGFKWGLEWISENPGRFLQLAFAKQTGLLGDNSEGAYWGIKRGGISSGALFIAMKGISIAYWVFIMFLTLMAVLVHWRSRLGRTADISLLMTPLLYVFVIDSIFEAGARHHFQLTGAIAVVAALLAHSANGTKGRREAA